MVKLDSKTENSFKNKQYGIVGNHSAVEICSWTKKALLGKGVCYKQKFYGAHTHKCAQIAPTVAWCQQNCLHCWRPMEMFKPPTTLDNKWDSPSEIIEGVIEARKKLLSGFGGNDKVDKKMYEDALIPDHWAISLSGEPTLYPLLPEMIEELKRRKARTIFIVTNGQEPEMLEKMNKENKLPTQLYVSLIAPNKELYQKLALPFYKDGWDRLMKTLEIWKEFNTRRVIRITHIKGINDSDQMAKEFAEILERAKPDFVEVKAYMYIGYSRNRLKEENMPTYEEVKTFTERILEYAPSFRMIDHHEPSRITLSQRKDSKYPEKIYDD